ATWAWTMRWSLLTTVQSFRQAWPPGHAAGNMVKRMGRPLDRPAFLRPHRAFIGDANGMDRPRSHPAECTGDGCQEKEHPHASHNHYSPSDRHRHRYGQDHTAHGRPGFTRCHRAARESLARTDYVEACEPATLPHWHRSRYGDPLCCS